MKRVNTKFDIRNLDPELCFLDGIEVQGHFVFKILTPVSDRFFLLFHMITSVLLFHGGFLTNWY